jgi:hypothetical protein
MEMWKTKPVSHIPGGDYGQIRPNLNWANDLIVDQKLNQSGGC